jgi:hypothetical protein
MAFLALLDDVKCNIRLAKNRYIYTSIKAEKPVIYGEYTPSAYGKRDAVPDTPS